MDGIHDMGGMQGFGAVVTPGSEAVFHAEWEARQAAVSLLTALDRSVTETMPARQYLEASYYERWLWATEQILLREGSIALGEIEAWQERLANGEAAPVRSDPSAAASSLEEMRAVWTFPPAEDPRFGVGDRVRVRRMRPTGHNRCPRYVRGVQGTVHALLGVDRLPDADGDASSEPVYSVAFASADLWGRSDEEPWTVIVDLWESYLEPMEASDE
jgi:nitrile hydratase subunit beta